LNLPGVHEPKAGSCRGGTYGIDLAILDPKSGEVIEGNDVEGVLAISKPWPGMARTCLGDHEVRGAWGWGAGLGDGGPGSPQIMLTFPHPTPLTTPNTQRYKTTYLQPYPGFYFAGDGARRDSSGYIWVTGRVDDVINSSGHRIGTAELESSLVSHPLVAQAAVVGYPHDIKGEGVACYCTLTKGTAMTDDLRKDLKQAVRSSIGPFATPDMIIEAPALPMTRSGKIMRRILRKIAGGDTELGDTSTLADPTCVGVLVENAKA
jgi:acetyl-CoA synthetase